jgi:hypothetical protein
MHLNNQLMGDVNMAQSASTIGKVKETSKKAADKAEISPFVETMARIGYGARGLIYFIMGMLAVQLAIGAGGKAADQQGAIAIIGKQPFGRILLWVILVGLASYALWGLVRAILDPLHKGHDMKGIIERVGFMFSAVSYAILILPTYAAISGGAKQAHNGAQGEKTQAYVGKILEMPWGRWMVGIAGLIVIGVGLLQIYQGIKKDFDSQIHFKPLSGQKLMWVKRLGRFGTVARGIVFALIGIFLIVAAYRANPGQAKGFDGALISLLHQPFGTYLMGIVAVGLAAMGIYSFLIALWFRLKK